MTTDVVSGQPVPRRSGPRRIRAVGGARPRRFDSRLVVRCGIAGIPAGALTGILLGLLVLRQSPAQALWSYGAGAAAGLLLGLVLGTLLAGLRTLVSRLRRPRRVSDARRLWVRHRADGPTTRVTARR